MIAPSIPIMREFRTKETEDGVLHLIFDMPGRSMNVFSNAAIHEIEAFADWLSSSDVRGVVVCSGKASAYPVKFGASASLFCAATPSEICGRRATVRGKIWCLTPALKKV